MDFPTPPRRRQQHRVRPTETPRGTPHDYTILVHRIQTEGDPGRPPLALLLSLRHTTDWDRRVPNNRFLCAHEGCPARTRFLPGTLQESLGRTSLRLSLEVLSSQSDPFSPLVSFG